MMLNPPPVIYDEVQRAPGLFRFIKIKCDESKERGLNYRYFVSYYRGKDKKKIKADGAEIAVESEIDFIIEENGVLYPIEIKQPGLLPCCPGAGFCRSFADFTLIQNTRSCVNVFSEGTICSRIVLRISFGMTTLPRSSILRTIPVGGIVRRMQEN